MKLGFMNGSLFYFVTLMLTHNQVSCYGCLENERIGLLDIKYFILSTGGEHFLSQRGDPSDLIFSWVDNKSSNCCYWERVKCSNISSGHVTELNLGELEIPYFSHLTGMGSMLNVSVFRPFEELRLLNLSDNGLDSFNERGGFSSLKKLEVLDLSSNMLNCSILPSLYGLTSLKNLMISDNNFNCSLSAIDLTKYSQLELLDLGANHFTGSIEGLCKLKDLVEIDISNNMFSGQLPECLSNITSLRFLELGHNFFTGKFPSFISNLTSLTYLSLYENYMQGSFSLSTLANHSNLQDLYISSQSTDAHIETEKTKWIPKFQLKSLVLRNCNLNMEMGSVIPSFLLYQYKLILVDLSRNKIVGSFPSWLIKSDVIQYFDLSHNNLNGFLPKDIGIVLPSVTYLNLSGNNLNGNIPSSIGKMKNIKCLDLSNNHLSGELPRQLAIGCDQLQYLKLSNNFLQGNVPKFWNSVNRFGLFLNNNNFSGTLEDLLGNNTNLAVLCISNNLISGIIPTSIGMFSNMEVLLLGENLLEGEIPIEISKLSRLEIMDLSQNKLTGQLPDFSNLTSLKFLYLQKNHLSGSIPFDLSGSSLLKLLDLRDNKFSGGIPKWMDNLAELRVLLLGGNNLEGDIPRQLCRLRKIDIMDLSRNMFNGSITYCFQDLSFGMGEINDYQGSDMGISNSISKDKNGLIFQISFFQDLLNSFLPYAESLFNASLRIQSPLFNQLDEDLHLEVEFRTKNNYYFYKGRVLENMTGLDLSCNKLTGFIPSQIGDLPQIRALNLSHNFLSGPIPITFANLTNIESLDLSYNNLSGKIPGELTQLNFLSNFNVSYNNFSGTPPSTGQFGGFDEKNYRGNPGLCGPLLNRKCGGVESSSSQTKKSVEKETKVDMISFYWSFIASYIVILLSIIAVLCINARWRMIWFYFMSKILRKFFPTFPILY